MSMTRQCQCALTNGPNKGQKCHHLAKYPPQYPRFCGLHRDMVEATQVERECDEYQLPPSPSSVEVENEAKNLSELTSSDEQEYEERSCILL